MNRPATAQDERSAVSECVPDLREPSQFPIGDVSHDEDGFAVDRSVISLGLQRAKPPRRTPLRGLSVNRQFEPVDQTAGHPATFRRGTVGHRSAGQAEGILEDRGRRFGGDATGVSLRRHFVRASRRAMRRSRALYPPNRPRHDQHPRSIREPDRSPALFVDRVLDIFDGHLAPVIEDAGSFVEPDVAPAECGARLRRMPVEHAETPPITPHPPATRAKGTWVTAPAPEAHHQPDSTAPEKRTRK